MNEIINSLINDIQPISSLTKWILQFNDYNLTSLCWNASWVMVKTGNTLSLDNITIERYTSEILDWWIVIDKRYWNKSVKFTLFIQGDNYSDLVSRVQELKKNLNSKNGKLYFTLNGVVYTYTATCTDITIPDFSSLDDFIDDIWVTFLITSPHGILEEPEVIFLQKTNDFEKIVLNSWDYKTYPQVIIIWKTGANISSISIDMKQTGAISGETLTITTPFTEWDVLSIDYKEKLITLNGDSLNWDWFMMPLETGSNVMDFTFTGTTKNFDIYILHNKILL